MKRSTKIIAAAVAFLILAVCVLAWLNRGDLTLKRELSENREFLLRINGETAATVTMSDMLALKPTEFETIMDTSISDPAEVRFTGVELREILAYKGIEIPPENFCEAVGLDSYYSSVSYGEIMEKGRVYICVAMNGKPLAPKEEGGMGPFLMVITGGGFSMRWCKYVEGINIR